MWVAGPACSHADWRNAESLLPESIRPARPLRSRFRVWEEWRKEPRAIRQTSAGSVEYSVEVLDVALPLVSFRQTYRFLADGAVLTSDSTLRFCERREIEEDLASVGFDVIDVRDAPDRPGREFVFITQAALTR